MAMDFYKGHMIVSSVTFDPEADAWLATVNITWRSDSSEASFRQLEPPQRFVKAAEALSFGLKLGKAWADGNL